MPGSTYYRPEAFEAALAGHSGAWLPAEWAWHRAAGAVPRGECCGIVGGTRVDFLRHYAHQGLRLLREPRNWLGLISLPDRPALTITLEQYLLAACVEHHRGRAGSPYRDVEIAYLFPSWADAACEAYAAAVGFTHLSADTKRSADVAQRLERRVMRDYPERYERCLRHLSRSQATTKQVAAVPWREHTEVEHAARSVELLAPGSGPGGVEDEHACVG